MKRERLAQAAPRALTEDDQRLLLRAAETSRPRDRAIVTILLYTALRLHELVALDVDDVQVSARGSWWCGRARVTSTGRCR